MKSIRIKSSAKLHLRQGYQWFFSNEVYPSKEIPSGGLVDILDTANTWLGWGYYNPHSLIAIRLMDRLPLTDLAHWFRERIMLAKQQREFFYPGIRDLRWIFSESDGLPGLIVDQYGDYLILQINTAGMELLLPSVLDGLVSVFQPRGIGSKSDQTNRMLEGLPAREGWLWGEPIPSDIRIQENGLQFQLAPMHGQKTGFFYDQKDNRRNLRQIIRPGMEVLDVFCYSGAWGINAMAGGAGKITFLDRSTDVLSQITQNVSLNYPDHPWEFIHGEAIEKLKELKLSGKKYDCVILDPPAFIKNRKHFQEGKKGYHQINQLGLKLVKSGGFLISCSCSHHLSQESLAQIIQTTAAHDQRRIYYLFSGNQALDHPVMVTHPETAYLKCLFYRVF